MIQCEKCYNISRYKIYDLEEGVPTWDTKIIFIRPGTKLQLTFHGLVGILEVAFPDETYGF